MTDTLGGLRQRKRQQTTDRIIQTALQLFLDHGFEATSLDAVAAAAGISRRTFFNYFISKDEILISLQAGMGDAMAAAVRGADPGLRPLDAVAAAFQQVVAQFPPDKMLVMDRLMRRNAAVQATKQASYAQHEQKLSAALRDRWPDPARETALRLIAVLAVGALRLSMEEWAKHGGQRAIGELLQEAFAALRTEV